MTHLRRAMLEELQRRNYATTGPLVQQLPRSALPEVSDRDAERVGGRARAGAAAGGLRPPRLHDARAARPSRAREQAHGVRPPVPGGRRNLAAGREQSEATGRRHRRPHGAAHLGPTTAAPSSRPLRRADGRLGVGRHPVGPRSSALLPPDCGLAETLSRQARGRPPGCLSRGAPRFPRHLGAAEAGAAFRAFLRALYRQAWVVYAKPPFGSPAHVLHYLARYTHRVAISNHRLVNVTDDTVSFRWKDYRHGSRVRTLTLDVDEFLRRFLLHVLPKRFVRIRYFGFLASRCRTPQLAQCRQALAAASAPPPEPSPLASPRSTWPCPRCGGAMRLLERLTTRQLLLEALLADILHDTS